MSAHCSFKGNEPSPKGFGICAHLMPLGMVKKGKDGNKWIIVKVSNGSLRWQKLKEGEKKIFTNEKNSKKTCT